MTLLVVCFCPYCVILDFKTDAVATIFISEIEPAPLEILQYKLSHGDTDVEPRSFVLYNADERLGK